MTDYDPNYTPEEDAFEDDPEVVHAGKRLAVLILLTIGLAIAIIVYVSFGLVCGAPDAKCIWPFNY